VLKLAPIASRMEIVVSNVRFFTTISWNKYYFVCVCVRAWEQWNAFYRPQFSQTFVV
jgi:hypothetical protein